MTFTQADQRHPVLQPTRCQNLINVQIELGLLASGFSWLNQLARIIINWCECSNLFSEASVESVASDGVGSICSLSISGERLTSARAPLQLASKPSFTGLADLPSGDLQITSGYLGIGGV